jgi:hypothetical protein
MALVFDLLVVSLLIFVETMLAQVYYSSIPIKLSEVGAPFDAILRSINSNIISPDNIYEMCSRRGLNS